MDGDDVSDSESTSESEDEDAFLATEDLDAHISETLNAIKSKDPRIYDKNVRFFPQEDTDTAAKPTKKEKPLLLKDYHRDRYLSGAVGSDGEEEEKDQPKTYVQEQADLKKSIVAEINAAAQSEDEADDDFLKPKEKPNKSKTENEAPKISITEEDIAKADEDPEKYLSNFMAARAWTAPDGSNWQAFESDDGDSDVDRADEIETAFNMRFEDPEKSNEVLKSYARDVAAQKSVRREKPSARKRQRELEKQRKEEEKAARRAEKERLKKLKLEEAEAKLQKIRATAGMSGKKVSDEELIKILDSAWEDDKWEEEMKRRFGEDYYAEDDDDLGSRDGEEGEEEEGEGEDADGKKKKKKKPKKPKWDDDIDITDVVGDYGDDASAFKLSDAENEGQDGEAAATDEDEDEDSRPAKKRKTKDHKREREAAKREAKKTRQALDALVSTNIELETHPALPSSSKDGEGGPPKFRWRETSPRSFGLSNHDILLAPSDAALNKFAGLKKYAAWRDPEAKRRDKKRLGKKARLRKWRRETFGKGFEDGPPAFEGVEDSKGPEVDIDNVEIGTKEKKKRKRKRGHRKAAAAEA